MIITFRNSTYIPSFKAFLFGPLGLPPTLYMFAATPTRRY